MAKVSVIIPARNEPYLSRTIADLLANATGDIEIIAVLDGYWSADQLSDDKRLIILHRGSALGMRAAINAAADIAHGEYLMKSDAHCAFAHGYDEVLQADCDRDWIVIPSRYPLDAENWTIDWHRRVDYHYLSCPWNNPKEFSMHGQVWSERARSHRDIQIDDEMSFQGSCWFMHRDHFHKFLGGMSEFGYGTFTQEAQEIGMKTWLGGGAVKVNKNTYYAHLHKRKGRGYPQDRKEIQRGADFSAHFWTENHWGGRVHDFEWLIDRFAPVPSWPDNWKDVYVHSRQ